LDKLIAGVLYPYGVRIAMASYVWERHVLKALALTGGLAALSIAAWSQAASAPRPVPKSTLPTARERALLDQYCVACHNQKARVGGLTLDSLDLSHPAENAETLEKVIRKLRAGMMPPSGARRPDLETYEALAASLESGVDQAVAGKPTVAPPGVHRANRAEYANAVHDLVGVDIDPGQFLPVDDASSGFDNVAGTLTISPALVEGYVAAAGKISRLALGRETAVSEKRDVIPGDRSQESHIEGLPLGTRGGALIKYSFPTDGEYVISWHPVRDYNGVFFGGNRKGEKLEILLDGERLQVFEMDKVVRIAEALNEKNEVRLQVKAGMHTVGAAFLATTQVPIDDLNQHNLRSVIESGPLEGFIFSPQISQLSITGPYNAVQPKNLLSRGKILICQPTTSAEELPCAKKILSDLARRAYRRPAKDADMEELLSQYQAGRNAGDFENGIQRALQAILSDPEFVFRPEAAPANVKPGQIYRISDLQLASRLSFFLWSTAPDDQLLALATQEKLHDPAVLEQQARRMLADPRSHALVTNFAGQWLQLRNLSNASPIAIDFPDFDDNLREAFKTETEMLFESIVREDRNVVDLLDADYTFVNERLARHYGIPGIYGSHFRRVKLDGDLAIRRGLLGKGSIELVTSLADRTSPVQRGKWVLMNILGIVPPNPPPNVPPLKESGADGGAPIELSMRQRMEEHRANAVCASCHKMFDPIGFSLESFDAIGRYRTTEFGKPIDTSGQLTDGTKFSGPMELRQVLMKYSPQFVRVMTEKLLTYALGRGTEYFDMPVVRAIDREAERENNKFSAIVLGIVKSTPFQMNVRVADSVAANGSPAADKPTGK
jgi:mono/diheme cytochrome c family protein